MECKYKREMSNDYLQRTPLKVSNPYHFWTVLHSIFPVYIFNEASISEPSLFFGGGLKKLL